MDDRFARLRLGRLVLWPLAGAAAVLAVALAPPHAGAGATITAAAYVVFGALLLAGLTACRAAGIAPAEVVGPWPRGARPWLTAAAAALLLLLFTATALWASVALLAGAAPDWAARQLAEQEAPTAVERVGAAYRLLLVLNMVLVGPAVEEFAFRGLLLRRWVAARGVWPGLLGSAAVLAVLHPHMWVGALTFGVVLGLLYLWSRSLLVWSRSLLVWSRSLLVWSRSLLVPIVAHVLHNGLVALAALPDAADEATEPAASPAQALAEVQAEWALPVATWLVAAALLGALARPLVREVRGRAGPATR